MNIEFPTLKANELEVRVKTTGFRNGQEGAYCSLLIYKDTRCDQKILDQKFGVTGWQNYYSLIDGQLFCTIEIWDQEKNMWVKKQNVGTVNNTEPEKSRASDAFKRACFNLGIGRELYSAPKIFINLAQGEYQLDKNGKPKPKGHFVLKKIEYDADRNITYCEIANSKGRVVYPNNPRPSSQMQPTYSTPQPTQAPVTQTQPAPQVTPGMDEEIPFNQGKAENPQSVFPRCSQCGKVIETRVKDYSLKMYGRSLCRECQKAAK